MFEFVRDLIRAKKGQDCTLEERNLMSNAFKSSIEGDRDALKIVRRIAKNEKFSKFGTQIKAFQRKLERNVVTMCNTII